MVGATKAQDQSASPPSPTYQQLQIQVSLLQDQIKALSKENLEFRGRAELAAKDLLSAYIETKKAEYDYDRGLMTANLHTVLVQEFASYVILLLVVIVVVSGVTFSGFQLWKSVSIAGVQANSDLEISAAKVRVTSSVVGIVVLAISLAFLFIYTTEVYTIKRLQPIQQDPSTTSNK